MNEYIVLINDEQSYKPQIKKYIFNSFLEAKEFFKNVVKSQLELDEAWAEDNQEYISKIINKINNSNNFEDLKELEDILDDENFIFNYYQDVFVFKDLDNLFTIKLIKL